MGTVRCPKCGHVQEEHLRACQDCGRPVKPFQKRPPTGKVVTKNTGALSQRLSAKDLLEKSGEGQLVFKDNVDEALIPSAEKKDPGHWVHCPPFEPRPLEDEVRIGRAQDIELPLVHIEVSRHHATVKKLPSGEIVVIDQQSANGTFVNDERVTTRVVRSGDRIKIGPFAIQVLDSKDAKAEPAPGEQDTLAAAQSEAVGKTLESTMVMGRLDAVTRAKILRHVEQQRRTGTLKVYDGKGSNGQIVVGSGSPLSAAWGSLKDEPAVRAMLRLPPGGAFAFSLAVPAAPPSMKMSLSQLVNELPPERIEGGADKVIGLLDDYSATKSARAFAAKALEHARQGSFDQSIADFSRALELDANFTFAWYNRGLAREKTGDVEGAIDDYTQAITIDPANVALWMRRAVARGAKADLDGTITDCTQVLRIDPRAAQAYTTRSCARRGKGDFVGAIDDASRALQLDQSLAIAWLNRGLAREKTGDGHGARGDLENYLTLLPASPLAGTVRAVISRLLGV